MTTYVLPEKIIELTIQEKLILELIKTGILFSTTEWSDNSVALYTPRHPDLIFGENSPLSIAQINNCKTIDDMIKKGYIVQHKMFSNVFGFKSAVKESSPKVGT